MSLRFRLGDFCCFCRSLSLYVCFCCFCVFLFFYTCIFACKCKSLKRLGEDINKHKKKHKTQTEKLKEKQNKQKYRISSPRTSANKSHKIFAEVRGLDILFFCLLLLFLEFVLFFVMFLSICFSVFA